MSTRALSWMLIWAATAGGPAMADQWLQACEKANQESQKKCKSAYDSYKSSDASRLASGMASSTKDTHGNAINLKGKIDAAKAELDKDIAQCQQAQKSCESECDKQKGMADAEAAKPDPNPRKGPAKADSGAIPGKKASDCTGEIQPKTAEMQAGRAPLDQQSNEANNTKDQSQSGGGAPQMPQSPSGDKSSDSGTTAGNTTATAAATLNCAVSGASRFSDCNTQFVSKCTASMSGPECDSFSDRYCNLTSAASQPALAAATTNLVIDKKGEGLGSQYCSLANSYRYCQTPGRETCPSCIKVYAQSTCQGIGCIAQTSTPLSSTKLPNCQDDPSYLTPVTGTLTTNNAAAVAQLTGGSAITGSGALSVVNSGSSASALPASLGGMSTASTGRGSSGSTGGGSFGSGGGSGAATAGGAGSNREDNAGQIIGSAEVSGGGGGGGGDTPWVGSEERDLASLDVMKAFDGKKNEPATAVAGVAADVSNAYGPSIFSIGSGAIHGFCVRGRIPNCN